ncbi:MAG TPA: BTAD domain-containing putative transcriptional regulator, partial [Anaerolineales bacterium]|nr:BTAD domain-containing putative transcriptional regulator [Anaerolineales bacterium]
AEFEREATRLIAPGLLNAETAAALETTLNLYRGDFLEGFYLRDGRGFEEWAVLQRERLRRTAHTGFRALVRFLLERGNPAAGLPYAEKLVAVDPYDEDSTRQLMHLYLRNGQPAAALQAYQRLRRLLQAELHVEPAAATRALFERVRALPFPPPVRLPADPTPFLGREAEIETVWQVLISAEHRLITLFGPGGMGKTRLSIEVARRFALHRPGQFLDGIFFIPLATVQTAPDLVTTLAEEIGFSFSGPQPPQRQLLEYLRPREMLLILDNFEQFLSESGAGLPFLVELLRQAPGICLLLTSRERVNLYEEVVFDLPGLALPEPTQDNPETFSAVILFAQTARRAKAGFAPTPEETRAAVQICRLLDGTPLAIELAASWVRQYPLAHILDHLRQSLDFLRASYRNLPERHRSLRAVFDHSWELLAPPEQAVFCQLAIFEGDFTPAAAEAVVSFQSSAFRDNASPMPAEAYLTSLADKSLLQPHAEGRFALHPLLRQFAAEKQAEFTGVQNTLPQRHAAYYLHFAAQQGNGEAPSHRAALRADLANLRAAWQWAVHTQDFSALQPVIPILHNFFSSQSWFQEGTDTFAFAVAHLTVQTPEQAGLVCELFGRKARMHVQIGQLDLAREMLEQAQTYLPLTSSGQRFKLLDTLAITYFYAGEYARAAALAEEILRYAETTGNQEGVAFAVNFWGSCAKALGDYSQATALFTRAVAVYQSLQDTIGAAMVLNNLGNLEQARGDFTAARGYYRESSRLFKVVDHLHGAATTLANEGKLALKEGDLPEAERLLTESLELKEKMHDQRGIALALISLGDISAARSATDPAEAPLARARFAQALTLAQTVGDLRLVMEILVAILEFWVNEKNPQAPALWAFIRPHPALAQEARERGERV